MKRRVNQFVAFVLVACLAITFSCEKNENEGDAPLLPPASTFLTDFSEFEDGVPILKATEITLSNFQQAAIAVWYTNSILTAGLAIPVAAYLEAVDHEPVRVDNDTWRWSYDVVVDEVTYTAQLTADVVEAESIVNWEMRIIQGTELNFVWYTGSCNTIATEGTWTLYDNPVGNHEFMNIDWVVDYEAETCDVTYTIVYAGSDYYESYINYGITDEDPLYDAYYNVYDTSDDLSIFLYNVYYNTVTHIGKYKETVNDDPVYEGCWDESFNDTTCPGLE